MINTINKPRLLILIGGIILIALLGLASATGSLKTKISKSSELGYFSESPNGPSGGAIIPASCESGYSHSGECTNGPTGNPEIGTFVPVPQQLCSSPPTSCGMTQLGFGPVGGPCPMPAPSDSQCQAPAINFRSGGEELGVGILTSKGNQMVNWGPRCTINWEASPATSCTITGPGLNYVNGPSGSIETPPMERTTTFNITCYNGNTVSATTDFTCQLNPRYEEIN